jgi:large subunit ribosomal protein L25
MKRLMLSAVQRSETGKGPARRLRAAGQVPAIFYGKDSQPIKLALRLYELKKLLDQAGSNPLFDLKIQDGAGTSSRTAMLKERQINPVDSSFIHLDFVEVRMDEAIEVTVPLEFVGKPAGVDKGGMFQAAVKELRILCLPDRIPAVIQVDVSPLEIGHSIHVADIALPEGVQAAQEQTLALANVLAPEREEEKPVEEEAAAEAAEGTGTAAAKTPA